jgi:hypothetical protein
MSMLSLALFTRVSLLVPPNELDAAAPLRPPF